MSAKFQIEQHATYSLLQLPYSSSLSEAITALQGQPADYVVISGEDGDLALVEPASLVALGLAPSAGKMSLQQCIPRLPPLFVIDVQDTTMSNQAARDLTDSLLAQNIPALAVMSGPKILGAVPLRSLLALAAKPLLADPSEERSYGVPYTPVRTYVCFKCSPPSRRRPRSGEAPTCPLLPSHGPMTREG